MAISSREAKTHHHECKKLTHIRQCNKRSSAGFQLTIAAVYDCLSMSTSPAQRPLFPSSLSPAHLSVSLLHLSVCAASLALILLRLLHPLFNILPIDDRPYVLKILSTSRTIEIIISMLPYINTKQRHRINHRILIGFGDNLQTLACCVVSQPSPATALHRQACRSERGLQRRHAAELRLDGAEKIPSRWSTSSLLLWCEVGPEDGVVDVAAAIEVDRRLQRHLSRQVMLMLSFRQLSQRCVEVVDISLVMLLVMRLHDLTTDGRLECVIVIRERRQ